MTISPNKVISNTGATPVPSGRPSTLDTVPAPTTYVVCAQLGSPWPAGTSAYSNVVNIIMSNTGDTPIPSGWLLTLTAPTGAPYTKVDQAWNVMTTLFKGDLAGFASQVRARKPWGVRMDGLEARKTILLNAPCLPQVYGAICIGGQVDRWFHL